MSDSEFVLTTPAQINAWQVLSVRSQLGLQVKTGMSHSRGSVMNVAKELCGSSKRTKRGVYEDLNKWMVENGFPPRPLPPVEKA